jgi:hypothetical protein
MPKIPRCPRCLGWLALSLVVHQAAATERLFTYTYEPETMPAGAAEFEQWITLRTHRTQAVGQADYHLWEFRQELEYGVTDNYSVSLYLNTAQESFRDPAAATHFSRFHFDGISIENRYLVLNPADHAVGLTLYLEPRFSGLEAEIEEKIILGQRWGDWKWAFNLSHATEWSEHWRQSEGELEASFGLTRQLKKRWAVGLELRDHNDLPDYARWENTGLFAGPVISYQRDPWWATLTVLPQIYGANFGGDPDGHRHLDLVDHERLNVRLIFGISF